nr:acyltransferase, putative [Tanacetum cinerariifolium]
MLFSIPVSHSRIFGLDLLRAGAILTVMLSHTSGYLPAAWAPAYLTLQWDGVGNFFVLSGFLIGGILLKTLEKQPASRAVLLDFWNRRWLRTLPPYLLVLFISFAIAIARHEKEATWYNFFKYAVFSQNLRKPHPAPFGEAWSLSIEEWF